MKDNHNILFLQEKFFKKRQTIHKSLKTPVNKGVSAVYIAISDIH